MSALYALLLLLARPLVLLRLSWRARKTPEYGKRTGERFGRLPDNIPRSVVWVHTVSAGETIAAAPLIRALAAQLGSSASAPRLLVTTMTPTGSAEVRRLFGTTVAHCYAPYDFKDAVQRFVGRVEPTALVLMETEIWPNMIRVTADRNVPVVLLNARLSERSARGYGRVGTLIRPVLRRFTWIACQYAADAERFRALGVSPAQLDVTGSVKFDVAQQRNSREQDVQISALSTSAALDSRPVWIAGSTHPGEDELVLAAHQELQKAFPELCLLLVPRHPERFDEVARLAATRCPTQRLSTLLSSSTEAGNAPAGDVPAVVVVDVMGLLRPLYGLAQVAFVGGSLIDRGGHNPIEAAVAGVPIIMGPGRHNFVGVCALFAEAGCLHEAADAAQLRAEVARLLADASAREAQGRRARELVAEHAGASARLLTRLLVLLAGAVDEADLASTNRPDAATSQ